MIIGIHGTPRNSSNGSYNPQKSVHLDTQNVDAIEFSPIIFPKKPHQIIEHASQSYLSRNGLWKFRKGMDDSISCWPSLQSQIIMTSSIIDI